MSMEDDDKVEFDLNADRINNPGKYRKTKKPKRGRTKPRSPHYKANNDGGFGNPPTEHQFKPGNKGGGRKKGVTSLESEMRRIFRSKVPLADGTKTPMVRALAELTMKEVLTNQKLLPWGHELAAKYGPQEAGGRTQLNFEALNDDELHIFGILLARVLPEPSDAEDVDVDETATQYALAIYQEYGREDGELGIKQIDEKRKRWALPENHPLGYPRDPNSPKCYYVDSLANGETWRRSRNPDYPDVLIGKRNHKSHLPKDHPDYDGTPDWEIDPKTVRFEYREEEPFEPPVMLDEENAGDDTGPNELE